jgi:hypothetical protein
LISLEIKVRNMSVDDLCDMMSGLIPNHCPYDEMDALKYSSSVQLDVLVNLQYLNTCVTRYTRYLKYIQFERYFFLNGYTIVTSIDKFLNSDGSDLVGLATLSVKIDTEILRLFSCIRHDEEEIDEQYFEV